MAFDYYIPTKILFGKDKLNDLGKIELPGKKALICITEDHVMSKLGYLDKVISLLKANGAQSVVFDEVQPNPTKRGVMKAAELGRKEGCDFTIGLGGGSSIDTAKATAVMLKNPGDLWDFMGGITGKLKPITHGAYPIIAISTTAGTGSEVNPFAVITKEETFEKIDLSSPCVYPTITIVDPCMHVSLPVKLTAYQGVDVLLHSAEGYIANCATPLSDIYALKSIELVAKHLSTAVKEGSNLEAREGMALANVLAGMVESTSASTSEHAIGHSFGAMHPTIPHGCALTLVCVECFKYYAKYVPEKMADMAVAVGKERKAEAFVDFLEELLHDIGTDNIDYKAFGLDPVRAAEYAQNSYDVTQVLHDCDVHPVPLEDCIGIIQRSLK
jgi:alcohol dehydrogenase